jgi:hypothetical protein
MVPKARPIVHKPQCTPCWTICVFGVLGLLAGGIWIVHVIDKVFSGHALETVRVFGLYAMTYVEAFVLICAATVGVLFAAYLNLRDYLLWRDFIRKYSAKEPNNTPHTDARAATGHNSGGEARAGGRGRYAA